MTKSEFIRQHPNAKPAELVALAAEQGIELTAQQVSTVRYQDKKKSGLVALATEEGIKLVRARAAKPTGELRRMKNTTSEIDALFRRIGTTGVTALVDSIKEEIDGGDKSVIIRSGLDEVERRLAATK